MSLQDDMVLALHSAPETWQDPSLATSAATAGGDVQANAEVTAHANNMQATGTAVQQVAQHHGGQGLLAHTLGWLGGGFQDATDAIASGVSTVGHIANAGIGEVQHQYRYLRDVGSQHGMLVAIAEGLVIAGAATAAGVLTGGAGAAAGAEAGAGLVGLASSVVLGGAAAKLGGEAAGEALGHIAFTDSWKRTASATYVDPHGGQSVSPGRDLARLADTLTSKFGIHIEQHAGFDLYDAISSVGDGLFDLSADPLAQGLAMRGGALSAEGLGGILKTRWGGIGLNSEALTRALTQNGRVAAALTDMASAPNTAEGAATLLRNYPKFRAFIPQILEQNSAAEVGQLLVDKADAAQMLSKTLPRQAVGRNSFLAMRDAALNYGGPGSELIRKASTFVPVAWNPETLQMSRQRFDFGDTLNATQNVYRMARWGHTEEMARSVAGQFALATIPERMTIFRNMLTDNFAFRMENMEEGLSQTAKGQAIINGVGEKIDTQLGGLDAGRITPQFGFGADGRNLSGLVEDGQKVAAPILLDQSHTVEMPNYVDFDRSLKSLSNLWDTYGKVDDFAYNAFTQNVFKKWVLLSGGFALRVATGELLPQILKDPAGLAQNKVAAIAARRGWRMTPEEGENVLAVLGRWAADKGVGLTDSHIDVATEIMRKTGAFAVAPAAQAGHSFHPEIVGQEEVARNGIVNGVTEVPRKLRVTEDTAAWGPERDDHHIFWHKSLSDMAGDAPTVAAARAYQESLGTATGGMEERVHEIANNAAEEAAQKAMRAAVSRKEAGVVAEAAPGEAVDPIEEAAGKAARKAARETAAEEIGAPEGAAKPPKTAKGDEWDYATLHESLSEEERASLERIKQNAYDAAAEEARKALQRSKYSEATQAGVDAARQELDNTPESVLNNHRRHFTSSAVDSRPPAGVLADRVGQELPADLVDVAPNPHEDWARVITENMKGAVHNPMGDPHDFVLNALANGETPSIDSLAALSTDERPLKIIGSQEKPVEVQRGLNRFNQKMFDKLNNAINWMSREPIYLNAAYDNYAKMYKGAVDRGEISFEEAVQKAQERATMDVLPHVHNINERTVMADTMRNWMPFYFAQQQSYARLWRLAAENPAAFRRAQLVYTKLADFGGIYGDQGQNNQFVIPGAGYLTGGAVKALGLAGIPVVNSLPTAFSGNLKSLASMSPFLEGGDVLRFGPLVAMGTRAINNLLPETKALTDPLVGTQGSTQHFWEMMIPNATLRTMMQAVIPVDQRSQNKSVLDAVQSLENLDANNPKVKEWVKVQAAGKDPGKYPGLVPPATASDMERQDFINKVKNHARILTMFKAIIGSVSPVSPSLQLGDYQLKGELYNDIKTKGVAKAVDDFLKAHPNATPYTVFETQSGTASPIQASHPTQQWVRDNIGFIKNPQFENAASYFVPQSNDTFDQQIYNEQMAMGLRALKAPEKLIEDIHISEGNRWYFDDFKKRKDAALATATSPFERDQVNKAYRPELERQKLQNPIWYTNFSSGGRANERQLTITQMQSAFDKGKVPDSPMTPLLKGLLTDYTAHQANMLPGRTDAYASAQRRQETASWQSYLSNLGKSTPELTMAINNIFRGA